MGALDNLRERNLSFILQINKLTELFLRVLGWGVSDVDALNNMKLKNLIHVYQIYTMLTFCHKFTRLKFNTNFT